MSYAIVIPACDTNTRCREYIDTLLSSIRWGGYDCPVIIAFDNCSPEFIAFAETQYSNVISLPYNGERNLNFCANANRGLKYAYEQLHLGAFCINIDVCLPHRLHLEKIINSGLSSPIGEHIPGTAVQKFSSLNRLNDPACPCNQTVERDTGTPTRRFAAFCMWVSKYAFDKIGYLDQNWFRASFEDDDLVVRACLAGLPVDQFQVKVHHELDPTERSKQISSTGSYTVQDLGTHMQAFMKKWGIPPTVPHTQFADWILTNRAWDDKYKVVI